MWHLNWLLLLHLCLVASVTLTRSPTGIPSSQSPTTTPSTKPTSTPTQDLTCACGDCQNVEGNNGDTCIFSSTVYLTCPSDGSSCNYFKYRVFLLKENAEVTVNGDCELRIYNATGVSINENASLIAASVNITSGTYVDVRGTLKTSGNGPLTGVGSPQVPGYGASYGGSGGRPTCDNNYFSNINDSIGNINAFDDFDQSLTYGSGGGVDGGRAGGRIVIAAAKIEVYGRLLADGGSPSSSGNTGSVGAGSGGSILLHGSQLIGDGLISVKGGPTTQSGQGSGGGGRITVILSSSTYSESITFDASGGIGATSCNCGAAGTVYIISGRASSALIINNTQFSYAEVLVSEIASTSSLSLYVMNSSLTVPEYSLNSANNIQITDSKLQVAEGVATSMGGATGAVTIVVDSLVLQNSSLVMTSVTVPVAVTAASLVADSTSFVYFSSLIDMSIVGKENVTLTGTVKAVAATTATTTQQTALNGSLTIHAAGSVALGTILVNNLAVYSSIVYTSPNACVTANATALGHVCLPSIAYNYQADEMCSSAFLSSSSYKSIFNNKVLIAASIVEIVTNSSIAGSLVIICSDSIAVSASSSVNSDGLGCTANSGLQGGNGLAPSYGYHQQGGSGGASFGSGGNGSATTASSVLPGGNAYDIHNLVFYPGSGGGVDLSCAYSNHTSVGGGIVFLYADIILNITGQVSSNGKVTDKCGSGGAGGGSVIIYTNGLVGLNGKIIANGANGGISGNSTLPAAGGGGGGGIIVFMNTTHNDYQDYSFFGTIAANGGLAGYVKGISLKYPPTDGLTGYIYWPTCSPGYGNDFEGKVCAACGQSLFSDQYSSGECKHCSNKPYHSTYRSLSPGSATDSNCPYYCKHGYAHEGCISPLEYFVYLCGGPYALAFENLAIWLFLILPLIYFRLLGKRLWLQEKVKQIRFTKLFDTGRSASRYSTNYFSERDNSAYTDSLLPINSTASRLHSRVYSNYSSSTHVKHPQRSISYVLNNDVGIMFTPKELRLGCRLQEVDMPLHACRVFFLGVNNPFECYGGSWVLPPHRPLCLRPMINRIKYKKFAHEINAALSWSCYSIETLLYALVLLVFPAFAASLMNTFRRRRTAILLETVARYNHSFIRSQRQKKELNSIRVGVSPDNTLAYLDFLYDKDLFGSECAPLGPIGQPRLPISFRLAGHGTYFDPWFVDTNDILLQAVAQTDVASTFIDESWLLFIVELNAVLKTVSRYNLSVGIRRLTKFLNEDDTIAKLGGLSIDLCTFANDLRAYEYTSDTAKEKADELMCSDGTDTNDSNNENRMTMDMSNATRKGGNSFSRLSQSIDWFASPLLNALGITDRDSAGKIGYTTLQSRNGNFVSRDSYASNRTHSLDSRVETEGVDGSNGQRTTCFSSLLSRSNSNKTDNTQYNKVDYHGNNFNFEQLCAALNAGKVHLGIAICHPKVDLSRVKHLEDEDYDSAIEDEEDDAMDDDSKSSRRHKEMAIPAAKTEEVVSGPQFSTSFNTNVNKARELEKYYDIVEDAEKSLQTLANTTYSPMPEHVDGRTIASSTNTAHGSKYARRRKSTAASIHDNETAPSAYQHVINVWHLTYIGNMTHMILVNMCRNRSRAPTDSETQRHSASVGDTVIVMPSAASYKNPLLISKDRSKDSYIFCIFTVLCDYLILTYRTLHGLFFQYLYGPFFGANLKLSGNLNKNIVHIRTLQQLLGFLILCLNVTDCTVILAISFEYWCVWTNPTECADHTAVYLLLSLPPAAIVAAPVWGIATVCTGTSGSFARTYASWARLAMITALFILWIFIERGRNYCNKFAVYFIILYLISRLVQISFVDTYIALVERMRSTGGWDGLHTSLYQAQDNTIEIRY